MNQRSMRLSVSMLIVLGTLCASDVARAQTTPSPYPAMASLDQYLIADEGAEIALARTAAPASISDAAEVMVLRRDGYATAVKGTNGFRCMVQRSWANQTGESDFWNPKLRAPICFNPAASTTYLPIYLMKTRLVLAGKSKPELVAMTQAAMDRKELPPLAPGAMCYMMSKRQYLGDRDKGWYPHLMFFVAGDAEKSWGGNQGGSPVMAADVPEERVTIFMVLADKWSDGTTGPALAQ